MGTGRQPAHIKDLLTAAVGGLQGPRAVVAAWDGVAGQDLARHARPVALEAGCLVVRVDGSAWLHEATFRQPRLLQELQALLGHGVIRELSFRLT